MNHRRKCDLCESTSHDLRYRFKDLDVLRCRDCGLVFVEMHNPEVLSQNVYGPDYFQDRGEYFLHVSEKNVDEVTGSHMDSFRQGLDRLRRYKGGGGELLDLGCAVGVFLSMAQNRGWKVTGVDISEYAAEQARKRCSGEVFAGDLADLHFPEAFFDVITLWDVVEHFVHPADILREAHRILKDDGIILMDTPNEEALIRKVAYRIYRLLRGRIAYPAKKLYHLYHLFYFSEKTLKQLLDKCGFEAIEVIYKPIPQEKGRGNRLERTLVTALAALEKPLGMDYEILIIARKKR